MKHFKNELEIIASTILDQNCKSENGENKPCYSNREFMNTLIIFQNALMDKMWDYMISNGIPDNDKRSEIATNCGLDLRNFILEYTGLDTYDFDNFV